MGTAYVWIKPLRVVGRNSGSHMWFRWFNEAPVLLLTAVVVLVIVKPF